MNRLAVSTSPYLLQHKDNPVDWWPWTADAFAEARRRDVPVLLSVGYAACHWCHVMAHESFEDEALAARMNAGFVNIKVDREERPDVDAVYMEATQALTGSGGWPMTCLLTADGAPFYCGTYFPPQQFGQLLTAVSDAWRDRRDELLQSSARIVAALTSSGSRPPSAAPDAATLDEAAAVLVRSADAVRGGFGGAPKFPPAMPLEFLLRHHERTGSPASLAVVETTGQAMARGGMYDQLAGGFARYSVDANWVVPHFEKMLYDNALLLRFYVHWYRRTGSALAARVVEETAQFMLRELATPEGGFASALDADTDGVEGLTYAWTPAQLVDVLGADDGAYAARLLSVTATGTFEHGSSTLQLRADPDDSTRWTSIRARLLAARAQRPQPGRDDKVVTAWNGLALGALAEAAMVFTRPEWLTAATACAELLADVHISAGRLVRTSRDGVAGASVGVAEDYGCLAEGLLLLHQASGNLRWLQLAGELLDVALTRFTDRAGDASGQPSGDGAGDGGLHFYDTADDAEALIRRPWDPTDNATPSGQSSIAMALLAYWALTGSQRHRDAAEAALGLVSTIGAQHPRSLGWALATAEGLLAGPMQIAVARHDGAGPDAVGGRGAAPGLGGAAGPDAASGLDGAAGSDAAPGLPAATGSDAAAGADLVELAWRLRGPGSVVVAGPPDADGVELLAQRPLIDGRATAYVCRAMVCNLPVTDVAALSAQLTP